MSLIVTASSQSQDLGRYGLVYEVQLLFMNLLGMAFLINILQIETSTSMIFLCVSREQLLFIWQVLTRAIDILDMIARGYILTEVVH